MKSAVTITVDGAPRTAEVEPRTLMLWALEEASAA
jgi:aerobic-type carbon monoxide dehydrogenase small subunit (CoxS/CutS family)